MECILERKEFKDVYELLKRISPQFHPNLESEINLKEYSLKLASYATFLIYKKSNVIEGCIVFYPNLNTSILYIPLYWVDEKLRGQGIAKRMFKKILEYCEYNRFNRINLEVLKTNNAAFSLYKSLGFTPIEDRKAKYLLQFSVFTEDNSEI